MKTYIIIIILFYCCFSNAQNKLSKDYTYTVGEPYENIAETIYGYWPFYYTAKNNQIMTIKRTKKQLTIQKLDTKSLKLISSEEITNLPNNSMQEKIINLNNKYYYFYSSWSGKKTKHERLYYKAIDFEKGILSEEAVLLIDIPEKIKSFMGYNKFDIRTSIDSSKLMVKHAKIPKVKNNDKNFELIHLQIFDKDLNEIWAKDYKIPHTETKTEIIDYQVSTYGNVYILSKIFHDNSEKDKKRGKNGEQNYHMEINKISKDSESTIKVDLDDKFINGINMHINTTGVLTISGYYTKGSTKEKYINNNTDGVFVCSFDSDNNLVYKKTHEIPLSILKQYESVKTNKKLSKKEEEDEAEFTNLIPQYLGINNTGITLIGEQYFAVVSSKGHTTNFFYDILITKLDNKGSLLWMKKIPKKQRGNSSELSFSYFLSNQYHHLIFLDNIKNINLPLNKAPHLHIGGYGGYLTAHKINDVEGTISKDAIFDTNKVGKNKIEIGYRRDRVIEISENEFIMEVFSKKENRLIKISF